MCRIAGIIDKNQNQEQIAVDVKAMCNAMANGGPDDEGLLEISNNAFFGHRRLALIDLSSAGHQPMVHKDLTITFNGEIYNYLILKDELIKLGYKFNNQTDTEVILVGFEAWGTEIFEKLRGMFAFGLYDKISDTTYLVRDPSGIKPLYYSTQKNRLIFSSEVKAFQKTSYTFTKAKDWRIYFLAFGHIPEPFTTLAGVFSLQHGHYLKWNHREHNYHIANFNSRSTTKTINNAKEAKDAICETLKDAVNSHLLADAPIGVFLSGGLDSSILTLLANDVVGKNLNTLSINFSEESFSEEKYQKLITTKTAGKHTSCLVTDEDFNNHFNDFMEAMDQPTNDGINSWFVNKCAKENGLKAVLSGVGADELYGGYPSFNRMGLINFLKKLPRFLLRLAALIPSDRLSRIYYLSYDNPIGEYLFLRGFFAPKTIAQILQISTPDVDQVLQSLNLSMNISNLKGKERVSWLETNLYMQNQLLKDTDFMSMNHGVEVRLPFLDQNFVSLSDSITNDVRFQKKPKGLLIDTFRRILPEAIINRSKMGFSFPLQKWFIAGGQITKEDIYNKSPKAKSLIRQFKKGKLHWSKALAIHQVCSNLHE